MLRVMPRIRGLFRPARTGERGGITNRAVIGPRAPKGADDCLPVFECPKWPDCGCPRGTVQPGCPGKTSSA